MIRKEIYYSEEGYGKEKCKRKEHVFNNDPGMT